MGKERSMDPITCAIVRQMQKHHELQLSFRGWKVGVEFGRQQRKFDETESSYLDELCSDNSWDLEYVAYEFSRRDVASFWRRRSYLRNKLMWCCNGQTEKSICFSS